MSQFIYLLNAFEAASQHDTPAAVGYAAKRKALLEYVEKLESARPEALRNLEIFREAFSHISMHMRKDGWNYSMPLDEWDNHASVQDAIAEEHRLCGTMPSVPSPLARREEKP